MKFTEYAVGERWTDEHPVRPFAVQYDVYGPHASIESAQRDVAMRTRAEKERAEAQGREPNIEYCVMQREIPEWSPVS